MPYFVHPNPMPHPQGPIDAPGPSSKKIYETRHLPAFNDPYGHNYIYASNTPAPTDIVVGVDAGMQVYMDQVMSVNNRTGPGTEFAMTPVADPYLTEWQKRGFSGDGNGQIFAYATCRWLGHCGGSDWPGSSCSGFGLNGYCFKSNGGSLECGRATHLDDEYGESPIDLLASYPSTVFRCPVANPAKTAGSFVVKRMKAAGCMISLDANYDPLAEVHVPDYCATRADFKKGCLLAGALNYDPLAKQSAVCRWGTSGCADSTALNYNPLATIDNGSCKPRVTGCTLPAGVVTNPNPLANSPQTGDCVLLIEGCNDPTALNYDSRATVNTNSWCIPNVPGCMIPDCATATLPAGADYCNYPGHVSSTNTLVHPTGYVVGLSSSYSAAVTVHVASMCTQYRSGCTNPSAINYDALATVSTHCYLLDYGCLNPLASNYNSTKTMHWASTCQYPTDAPSPPPPPLTPVGATENLKFTATKTSVVAADYSTFTGAAMAAYKASLDAVYAVDVSSVDTELLAIISSFAGSATNSGRRLQTSTTLDEITVTYTVSGFNAAAVGSAQAAIESDTGTTVSSGQNSQFSALLAQATGRSVQVLSNPGVASTTVVVPAPSLPPGASYPPPPNAPSSSSSDDSTGVIVAVVVVVVLLLGAGVGFVLYKRKQAKPVYPA